MPKKRENSTKGEGEGLLLWEKVTRSVKAYSPTRRRPVSIQDAERFQGAERPAKRGMPKKQETPEKNIPSSEKIQGSKGFDRSTETKLKRGQLPLDGRIDLHGMTQAEAFGVLQRFLRAAIAQEKRTLLVITGKGRNAEGVLKRMLPLWLEDSAVKKHVLALVPAAPKDGGSGAFYIRLRKKK